MSFSATCKPLVHPAVCGTVEEKVLQLQETKRQLADAIVGAENSLIRELRAEDIALFEGGGFVWG
jgi:SNF2 family DNA or RNA helicase